MKNHAVFQVNLEGVLRILSESLYTSPLVFIRELLQNSADAMTARRAACGDFAPQVDITYFSNPGGRQGLVFRDNGIGLTREEVEQFLSRIGSSSKSVDQVFSDRSSYIGQFGIGMLSCFMVSDEIIVRTQSAKTGHAPVKWVGRIDGTYETSDLDETHPEGTSVVLTIREDVTFNQKLLTGLLSDFARFIKTPVSLEADGNAVPFSQSVFSWEAEASPESALEQGHSFFGEYYELSFPFELPLSETSGRMYLLNRPTHHGEQGISRIYIRNMLITSNNRTVLPPWAFFVRAVINSSSLAPTASREDVFKNSQLAAVQQELDQFLKNRLRSIATEAPELLRRIISMHTVAFKSLTLEDPEIGTFIAPWFRFETSRGEMTLQELLDTQPLILFVPDVEEFKRILPVARANDQLIVNAGYIYDPQMFVYFNALYPTHTFQQINAAYFGNSLHDLDYAEHRKLEPALARLQDVLSPYKCELQLKQFEPASIPALFYLSERGSKAKDAADIASESAEPWAFLTQAMNPGNNTPYLSLLYINAKNPVVERLLQNPSAASSASLCELLLFTAMMQSNVPLSNREQQQLNTNLLYVMNKLSNHGNS